MGIAAVFGYPKFAAGVEHVQTPFKVIVGLLGLVVMLAIISGLWFLKRIPELRQTILTGPVVAAIIEERTFIELSRSIGPPKRVPVFRYQYQWDGQIYEGLVNCTSWKDKHSSLRELDVGDEIAVIVDPTTPSRTFIRDFFWG